MNDGVSREDGLLRTGSGQAAYRDKLCCARGCVAVKRDGLVISVAPNEIGSVEPAVLTAALQGRYLRSRVAVDVVGGELYVGVALA